MAPQNYDAVLVLSFGGPEKPEDVIPFLENVLRGRNVPRERMLEVAEHYYHFGGKSPINDQNRALIAGLERELARHGPRLPVYWGNRNWHPFLADTLRKMQSDGVTCALAFVTSVFSSYSGCRQYLEDIEKARAEVGPDAPRIDKLRSFYNHPLFIEAQADEVRDALSKIPSERRAGAQVLFTAHSVPVAMAESSDYQQQLNESCRLVSEQLGIPAWRLVYQSRSGPPGQPWLEPDIGDVLRELNPGADVVIVPIGFISDHMEVLYDLDTEARAICEEQGIHMQRAATVGVHPTFLSMIRELISERLGQCEARAIGQYGPSHDECRAGCCPAPARRPSSARSDSSPRAIAQH
ncbi:MAG: ferrochelatase [Acidobacteriia bacterium]|nr:ferrochelatase [Terriglobia bacterium]